MKLCEPISASSKAHRGKEINDDREANRADASEPTSKEPENYLWGARSAHASVNWWVCSVLWSHNSFYDNDHIAADFQGPESTPKYCQTLYIEAQRVSRRSFTPYYLTISFREDLFWKLSEKLHFMSGSTASP